jgi:solute carrier family 13 (sodium-dependent dicarboxylate transporter), member 2/3/5
LRWPPTWAAWERWSGTPPNAIAAGFMGRAGTDLSFLDWMLLGLPPGAAACRGARRFLLSAITRADCTWTAPHWHGPGTRGRARRSGSGRGGLVFSVTLLLWMFGPAPASVVAFVPITVLSVTGRHRRGGDPAAAMGRADPDGGRPVARRRRDGDRPCHLAGRGLPMQGLGLVGAALAFALLTTACCRTS